MIVGFPGDYRWEGIGHPYRRGFVLCRGAPYQSTSVRLVPEDGMNRCLGPALSPGTWYAIPVECLHDVQDALADLSHSEHSPHQALLPLYRLQLRSLLGPILDHNLPVSVGNTARHPESPGGCLSHSPHDFLGQVLAVELVHTLYDGLHELPRWSVVGVLRY